MIKSNQIKKASARFSRLHKSLFNSSFLVIALLLPVVFAASCAESSSEKAARVGGITAQQIIENPAAYVGKTVTVSGDVEEIHSPRSFNMDSGASIGELLVVGREPFPNLADVNNRAYVINDVATVTGVVRLYNKAEIDKEVGWDSDPQLAASFNGKPVLVAQNVAFKPNANHAATIGSNANMDQTASGMTGDQTVNGANSAQLMNNNNGQITGMNNGQSGSNMSSGQTASGMSNSQSGAGMNNSQSGAGMNSGTTSAGGAITDPGVYTSTADKLSFVGKNAQFANARVVRVVGPRTFTIASGKDEIYVMLDDESARGVGTQGKIDAGDTVNVSGEFEKLDMAVISDIKNNRFRQLTDTERAFLKKTPLYLQAGQVRVVK